MPSLRHTRTLAPISSIFLLTSILYADTAVLTTIAGTGTAGSAGAGGPATSAQLNNPVGTCIDAAGNVYVAEFNNNRVSRIDAASGVLTVVAGTGAAASSGDGGPATQASVYGPAGVALDSAGNLYIAEVLGSRVRKIDAQSGIISTVAGNGTRASSGDGGPASSASVYQPDMVAFDSSGNMYILETFHGVRRVDAATGIIQTLLSAGTNGIVQPWWLGLDGSGTLYVSDVDVVLRYNASTGGVTPVAGNGTTSFNGDGIAATASALGQNVNSIAVDAAGNIYIGDQRLGRIRRVDAASGLIYTIAGNGNTGAAPSPDGIPAAAAVIASPSGLSVSPNGYIVYSGNDQRVRRVNLQSPSTYTATTLILDPPNPSTGQSTTFTATVTPAGGGPATGTVVFEDQFYQTIVGSVPLSGGTASLTAALPSTTTNAFIALYTGDSTFAGSTSPAFTLGQTPTKTGTNTTLSSGQNPTATGFSIPYTVVVTPTGSSSSQPGGTVQIMDGGSAIASGSVVNGSAQIPVTLSTTGHHSLTAVYAGDANFLGSTSAALDELVKLSTGIAIASDTNPVPAGSPVTFTATLFQTAATGSIQFVEYPTPSSNPVTLATVAVSSGHAVWTTSTLASGTHLIAASYLGDDNYLSTTSSYISQQVAPKIGTGTSIASTQNPTTPNINISILATVTPASGSTQPTGTVQLLDGSTVVATLTLASGSAQFPVSYPTTGSHSLTVIYAGDAMFAGSTSSVLTQDVKVLTAGAITVDTNPSTAGAPVTFTFTMSPSGATGTVQFREYATLSGDPVVLTTVPLSGGRATWTTSGLSVGLHHLNAAYLGDATYAGTATSILDQTVRAATSTTITGNNASSVYGTSVQLTATVSPTSATGTVQFMDGATSLGAATLIGGTATLAVSTLTAGTHSITAVYSGDSGNAGSTSPAWTQTVSQAATTATLASAQNPAPATQAITFTATVSPAAATGSVQFLDGATVLGTATVTSGSASFSATLAVGSHTLTAVYSGDTNYTGATSPAISQLATATTSTAVQSNAAQSAYGQAVQLTATVTPAGATGTVQFFEGATSLGTATISAGAAQLSVPLLAVGTHSITAAFGGDGGYIASTSPAWVQTVVKAAATATLASSANPSGYGQPVTFTATVSPSGATGTVQFLDGATVLGTATLSNGNAALSISALAAGSHTITASYSGDGNYNGATSAALSQTVNKAASGTVVAASANPATLGQSVTFTATVTPASATGSIQFLDGSTVLATVAVSGGSSSWSTASLSAGTHPISAAYSGDANYNGSASAALSESVKATSLTTLASNSNPSTYGSAVQITATITPSSATGSVQFFDGATPLGTIAVSAGKAVLAVSSLTGGSHSITAAYSGDANDFAGTSAALTQTVNKAASSTTVQSSQNPATFGQTVTFTATVTGSGGTGTVQFLEGATVLGTVTLSGGSAAFSTSALAVGAHQIKAQYSGDGNYNGSTSATLTQNVNKANTTTAVVSSANPSQHGQSVTFTATVSPGAATGTVQFMDGNKTLGTVTLSGGTAAFTTSSLSSNTHSITAVYGGNASYNGSTSAVLRQVVN